MALLKQRISVFFRILGHFINITVSVYQLDIYAGSTEKLWNYRHIYNLHRAQTQSAN